MTRVKVIVLAIGVCLIALGLTLAVLPSLSNAETPVSGSSAPTATPTATPRPEPTATPDNGLPAYKLPLGGSLTPADTLPAGAMSSDEVITFVLTRRFGPTISDSFSASFRQEYPMRAVSALYSATASGGGPAANNQPVWVVTIDGWGTPPTFANPGSRIKLETVVIVDAVTGAILEGWGHSQVLPN